MTQQSANNILSEYKKQAGEKQAFGAFVNGVQVQKTAQMAYELKHGIRGSRFDNEDPKDDGNNDGDNNNINNRNIQKTTQQEQEKQQLQHQSRQ